MLVDALLARHQTQDPRKFVNQNPDVLCGSDNDLAKMACHPPRTKSSYGANLNLAAAAAQACPLCPVLRKSFPALHSPVSLVRYLALLYPQLNFPKDSYSETQTPARCKFRRLGMTHRGIVNDPTLHFPRNSGWHRADAVSLNKTTPLWSFSVDPVARHCEAKFRGTGPMVQCHCRVLTSRRVHKHLCREDFATSNSIKAVAALAMDIEYVTAIRVSVLPRVVPFLLSANRSVSR
ncbi:hypothetical protein B0H14DRAFT_1151114 [Mycena olivaceomarginata]|nr:hypothetical protein B0H14DRAFT_1151114 [Mycena olivaceomarginata]